YDDRCFSGSALIDVKNTSGFRKGTQDLLVAAYTSTGRGECIVYSQDGGRTWSEYEGNPVVKHAGRDPKLLWYEPTQSWVMAVYDESAGKQWIAFYSSPDLKAWTFHSRIEGFFECPDLFELPVAGTDHERRWVLYGADGKYRLGRFDGRAFTPETEKLQVWYGNFYAAQTYSNAPDDRRVQIGWGNGIEFRGSPFNQQMVVPVELTLRATPAGVRMFAEPVRELAQLETRPRTWSNIRLEDKVNPLADVQIELARVTADFEPGTAEAVGLNVRGVSVRYDVQKQQITCRGVTAPLPRIDGRVRLEILVDRGSIEVFGNNGEVALSVGGLLPAADHSIRTEVTGAGAILKSLKVAELKSAWKQVPARP
ncbi:MAG: glycoside hydrolase family 32 protein, partial [Planctomycetes bacterium]|nr:glycoside hydrolase family 32 protein [Planctomycetota bacterium]